MSVATPTARERERDPLWHPLGAPLRLLATLQLAAWGLVIQPQARGLGLVFTLCLALMAGSAWLASHPHRRRGALWAFLLGDQIALVLAAHAFGSTTSPTTMFLAFALVCNVMLFGQRVALPNLLASIALFGGLLLVEHSGLVPLAPFLVTAQRVGEIPLLHWLVVAMSLAATVSAMIWAQRRLERQQALEAALRRARPGPRARPGSRAPAGRRAPPRGPGAPGRRRGPRLQQPADPDPGLRAARAARPAPESPGARRARRGGARGPAGLGPDPADPGLREAPARRSPAPGPERCRPAPGEHPAPRAGRGCPPAAGAGHRALAPAGRPRADRPGAAAPRGQRPRGHAHRWRADDRHRAAGTRVRGRRGAAAAAGARRGAHGARHRGRHGPRHAGPGVRALLHQQAARPGHGPAGPALAQRIGQRNRALRVLDMSGHDGDALRDHGLPDAALPVLRKPFSKHQLLLQVQRALDAPPPGGTEDFDAAHATAP